MMVETREWCWTCGHDLAFHKHADACRFEDCECVGQYQDTPEEINRLIRVWSRNISNLVEEKLLEHRRIEKLEEILHEAIAEVVRKLDSAPAWRKIALRMYNGEE